MCEYCDASSDEENLSPEVTVKEMRNGLYHIHLHYFGQWPHGNISVFEKTIQLCGAYSHRSYTIICDAYNHDDEENPSGFILTVKEMPCDNPSISGSEISTANSSLIEDLEDKPHPIHVWMKTNYTYEVESSMLPMVKCGSKKWRMQEMNPIDPDDEDGDPFDPCSISIWIDFGTGTTRERNVIMMSDGLAEMFYKQHYCDVYFDFKDSQTVGAHVVILSAGSPVFSAMFRSEFLESQTKKVNIIDIEIEVFRQLLIYLYTGSAPKLAEENMTQLLFVAADKYNIDNLKTECTNVLLKRVNLDNAISLLIWSHFHSVAKLKEATLNFLAANCLEICSQLEWMHLIKNYPELCLLATQHMSKMLNKTKKTVKST